MSTPKPKLVEQDFEARYERGYRYLDKTGDAMVILEESLGAATGQVWMPQEMVPKGAQIKCPALDIAIVFDAFRLIVTQRPTDVECDFPQIAETVLATITGRFDLRDFLRFGGRRISILATDSIEEAANKVVKLVPFKNWPLPDASMKECLLASTQESADELSGWRFQIAPAHQFVAPEVIDQRVNIPSRFLPKGQREAIIEQERRRQQRGKDPLAGVSFDIDYYRARPDRIPIKTFWDELLMVERRIHDAILKVQT